VHWYPTELMQEEMRWKRRAVDVETLLTLLMRGVHRLIARTPEEGDWRCQMTRPRCNSG
jgi:hypothetical protein